MFDFFKVSVYALTGKLKDNATLRKGYWSYLFAVVLSLIALSYNAFMSFSFYQSRLGQLPFAVSVSWLVTIGIALGVYFCMSFVTGYTLDLWHGRSEKTEAYVPLFLFCCLVLIGSVGWDIYANLEGVAPVSAQSTVYYGDNQESSVRAEYQAKIAAKHQEIAQIKHAYSWCPIHGKEALGSYCPRNVLNFLPYPTTSVSKKQHGKNVVAVDKIQAEIHKLEELQASAISAALDDYQRDKRRYDTSVNQKQITHTGLVKFIYIVVLLISFMTSAYTDAVIGHVQQQALYLSPQTLKRPSPPSQNGTPSNGKPSDAVHYNTRLTVNPVQRGYEITCQHCGKKAVKNSPNRAKYCSEKCRKAAYAGRRW